MNTVLKRFYDKTDDNKIYKKGDTYKHEDADRIAFLVEKGYLEKNVENEDPKEPKEPAKKQVKKKADVNE